MNTQNYTPPPISPERAKALMSIKSATSNMMMFVVLSAINFVLITANSSITFVFSAFTPQIFAVLGQELMKELNSIVPVIIFTVLSLIPIGLCLVSSLLGKKHPGWLIMGIVVVLLDSLVMLWFVVMDLQNFDVWSLIEIAFHVWILYYLFKGVSGWSALKKLPPEPLTHNVSYTETQNDEYTEQISENYTSEEITTDVPSEESNENLPPET